MSVDIYQRVYLTTSCQWTLQGFGSDEEKKKAKAKSGTVMKRLGKTNLELDEYERMY